MDTRIGISDEFRNYTWKVSEVGSSLGSITSPLTGDWLGLQLDMNSLLMVPRLPKGYLLHPCGYLAMLINVVASRLYRWKGLELLFSTGCLQELLLMLLLEVVLGEVYNFQVICRSVPASPAFEV